MRTLGSNGPSVFDLGLGCMGMSGLYGPADDADSIATIHAALDAGITLLDTGDHYGTGHNELLIRDALKGRDRTRVCQATTVSGQLNVNSCFWQAQAWARLHAGIRGGCCSVHDAMDIRRLTDAGSPTPYESCQGRRRDHRHHPIPVQRRHRRFPQADRVAGREGSRVGTN